MNTFPHLDDYLLPPPLAAVVSVTFCLALLGLGIAVAIRLRGRDDIRSIDIAAGMVLATGLVCALVNWLALTGLSSLFLLRLVVCSVIVVGVWTLRVGIRQCRSHGLQALHQLWLSATLLERWSLLCIVIVIAGLGLAALGPATEVDSLDYHLGTPLEWLRNGGALPRADWLTARFIGVGDGINLLGLAAGTDSLGALIQICGVLAAMTALVSCAGNNRDRIFSAAMTAGCLAWITLVPSQKPFVLPVAATTIAAVLLAKRYPKADSGTLIMVFGCIAFAAGSKYSFLFSGAVLAMAAFWIAWRNGRAWRTAFIALVSFFVMALPMYANNAWHYGDPLWPFLQRFIAGGDPLGLSFAWYLRNFGSSARTWTHLFTLPAELLIPTRLEQVGNALGIGCLAGLLAWRSREANTPLLAASAAVAILVLIFGQLTPRFFLEPYLWCGAAVATTAWGPVKRILFFGLTAQLTVMTMIAIYGAAVLFPGAFSQDWRARVRDERAPGSAVCRWMDRALPRDAIIASTTRAHALYPRPFVASDFARYLNRTALEPLEKRNRLLSVLKTHAVNVLVLELPVESGPYAPMAADIGEPLGPPVEFREATRNPLGRGATFTMQAFAIRGLGGPD